jgi:succinate dehydrogenase/fumarate reductase flavoprotein subunit
MPESPSGGTPPTLAEDCDVLVVGSGAAGLAAAVTAARHGLKVLLAEQAPVFGGTSAISGGWLWIPQSPHARRAGLAEDPGAARRYMQRELGNGFDAVRIDAFLAMGPRMLEFFERDTAVRFLLGAGVPDFHGQVADAGTGGRSVVAAPYDGRALGPLIRRLRPPLREMTLGGMALSAGADFNHFINARRSWRSALHVAGRLARHGWDLLCHGRSMQLVNGHALVARLLRSAADAGVELRESTAVLRLQCEGGCVTGAVLRGADGERLVRARRGVVLACGGFPHDAARQARLFAHSPTRHFSAAPAGNRGDGLRLGEQAGGVVAEDLAHAAAWAPVSLVPRADGGVTHFPHLAERGKPGLIAVTADGRRFVNEAGSYHDVMRGLFAALPPGAAAAAWLICDHAFQRRYGLGAARPFPFRNRRLLRQGYLRRAGSLRALALACGIDPGGLEATVADYNGPAREGRDPAFQRGGTAYERMQGDARHGPNPCVASIVQAPFYAVRIVPGSLGTFAGLRTDASARVLDRLSRRVPGLYAVGNDQASVMAGHYPAGGTTLGPAMTFGYIAGLDLAGRTQHEKREETPCSDTRSPP